MKSKNYIILSLIAIFILSSCGSISLTQRRYSRGINIDWLAYGKSEKPEEKKANVAKKKTNPTAANNNTSTVAGAPASAPAENATNIADDNTATVPATEKNTAPAAAAKASKVKKSSPLSIVKNVKKQLKESSHLKATDKVGSTQQTNESDVALILLVILAILLPPLAVFLYFGELNVHFWINLILWLITGGLYFGGGAFFFLSFAIIHALLVVFGVFG